MKCSAHWLLVPALVTLAAFDARAQSTEPALGVHPQVRADLIAAHGRTSAQVGAGLQIPAGNYARIGVIGALGSGFSSNGGLDARVDVLARFLFDPFRQSRWGVSAGAGVSAMVEPGDHVRPRLLVAIDLEGPRWKSGGVSPALQVGLGGGVRIGGVLRRGSLRAR